MRCSPSTTAPLEHVLELTVDEDAVVQRLLKRAEVEGRADDTEDVIRERMAIYHRETEPLAAVFRERGVLVEVDGMGEVDEVSGAGRGCRGAAASEARRGRGPGRRHRGRHPRADGDLPPRDQAAV
jgi:hypothetical protein